MSNKTLSDQRSNYNFEMIHETSTKKNLVVTLRTRATNRFWMKHILLSARNIPFGLYSKALPELSKIVFTNFVPSTKLRRLAPHDCVTIFVDNCFAIDQTFWLTSQCEKKRLTARLTLVFHKCYTSYTTMLKCFSRA